MKIGPASQIARRWGERLSRRSQAKADPREPKTSGSSPCDGSPVVLPRRVKPVLILATLAILFFAIPDGRTQQSGVQHASNFTSVEYFEPPHQQQVKSRLSGAEAQPQAGGLLVVKQLKLETFNPDGKPEIIVTAPECVYDTFNRVASSPGHLQLQSGDGKVCIEGEGFLWRQTNSFLIISNHVRTVIESSTK
jgi:hypothetical protein